MHHESIQKPIRFEYFLRQAFEYLSPVFIIMQYHLNSRKCPQNFCIHLFMIIHGQDRLGSFSWSALLLVIFESL